MHEHYEEIAGLLRAVRARWMWLRAARAGTWAATVASIVLLCSLVLAYPLRREPIALIVLGAAAVAAIAAGIILALQRLAARPDDRRVARFVEERVPDFDDRLVSAVDVASAPLGAAPAFAAAMMADTARRARGIDLDAVVPRTALRRAGLEALCAVLVAVALGTAVRAPARAALDAATLLLFPARVVLEVSPGNLRVKAGTPVRIDARLVGNRAPVTARLEITAGESSRTLQMPAADGRFHADLGAASASFTYRVIAGFVRSDVYRVSVARAPRVVRIDLDYRFPDALGLAPRVEQDSGDIYAPAGTEVRLTVHTDRPAATGTMALADGKTMSLAPESATMFAGSITVRDDNSYRIALKDADGFANPGDTEYFIRTIADRPPEVRIVRPAADRSVTRLEEVEIEAQADDDYGIDWLDLVYSIRGGAEKVVPFAVPRRATTATGRHTLFLEDLDVQPGDFVSYYARARDITRGKRSNEAKSDIFFLEVKPFEQEFTVAQSSAMNGGGGGSIRRPRDCAKGHRCRDVEARSPVAGRQRRQVRTGHPTGWPRRGGAENTRRADVEQLPRNDDARSPPGIAGRIAASGRNAAGRRFDDGGVGRHGEGGRRARRPEDQRRAAAGDGRAQSPAQGAGGGEEARGEPAAGGKRQRQQQPQLRSLVAVRSRVETAAEDELREPIVRRAARGCRPGDARSGQGAGAPAGRADEAAAGAGGGSRPVAGRRVEAAAGSADARAVRAPAAGRGDRASDERRTAGFGAARPAAGPPAGPATRRAAWTRTAGRSVAVHVRRRRWGWREAHARRVRGDARRGQRSPAPGRRPGRRPGGAGAPEAARFLERQLGASTPEQQRRALGELQLEARQLADDQRRVAAAAAGTASGEAAKDAARQLAGEQERLAERTRKLQEGLRQRGAGGSEGARGADAGTATGDRSKAAAVAGAAGDAARELERQQLADACSGRPTPCARPAGNREPGVGQRAMARSLDRVADRLGAATGAPDGDARKLSDQRARAQELKDRLDGLQRQMEQLGKQAGRGSKDGSAQKTPSKRSAAAAKGRLVRAVAEPTSPP